MIIDSSVWLEIFLDGPLADKCSSHISAKEARVPTSVIYEVYRKIKSKATEEEALEAIAVMSKHLVLPMTREIALLSADLSLEYNLGFSDSIVLASAYSEKVKLLTLDYDFLNLPQTIILR